MDNHPISNNRQVHTRFTTFPNVWNQFIKNRRDYRKVRIPQLAEHLSHHFVKGRWTLYRRQPLAVTLSYGLPIFPSKIGIVIVGIDLLPNRLEHRSLN